MSRRAARGQSAAGPHEGETLTTDYAIEVENLSFSYPLTPVLEDVTLAIPRGDFVCMVGPNGGGKTTLLRLILGLLTPARGTVRVFGRPPVEYRKGGA